MGSTRVLHRRYLRGEISEEQWEWYRTQPFHANGPINFRPFLEREWYESGGAEVVMLGINFYAVTIPPMPTVTGEWLSQHQSKLEDGTPPFSVLLPQDRFVGRARSLKKQIRALLAHPLFFEIATTYPADRVLGWKATFEKWKTIQAGGELEETEEPIPDFLSDDYLPHVGGASLGNVSWTLFQPATYPYGSTDRPPKTN